jgi:hypothetical protein
VPARSDRAAAAVSLAIEAVEDLEAVRRVDPIYRQA